MKKNKVNLKKEALTAISHVIEEISKVNGTIQAMLDVALDIQNQLSNLIVLQVELVLPTEEAKVEEIGTNDSPPSHEIADYIINIGPLKIYTLHGPLKKTFAKFKTQAASIADAYKSDTFLEKSVSGKEAFYNGLKKSALMVNALETIHSSIANNFVESMQSAESAEVRVSGTRFLSEEAEKKEGKASSAIQLEMEEFVHCVNEFSVTMEEFSNELNTKIIEVQEVIDNPALQSLSIHAPASFELIHTKQNSGIYSIEKLDNIKNYLEMVELLSSEIHKKTLDAHTIADVTSFNQLSSGSSSAALSIDGQHPIVYHGQTIVEIPVFKPRGKFLSPSEDAAINVTRLSDAITINHNDRKDSSVLTDSLSNLMMPYALSKYVSNAFESISDYVTMGYEINNHISDMTKQNENPISKIAEPFNLLLTGNEASAGFALERINLGSKDSLYAGGQVVDIVQSIAVAEALQRAGSSAIKDVSLVVSPFEDGYNGLPATIGLHTMENVFQMLSGSPRENAAVPTGSSTINFHNTFNIAVNVKGGGVENELQELGRKIGLILSDEIKRYGGIR